MSTYVVGDIQGCLGCLECLLTRVGFGSHDKLISVGDLVNRGPKSLETLRFCHSLGSAFQMVLGNHDLHLLAVVRGNRKPGNKDTIEEVINAPDRDSLLDWLQSQPLLLRHGEYTVVHAGIPPQWTVSQAAEYAIEVEQVLQKYDQSRTFFQGMYGNTPHTWNDNLEGIERLRCITNYFTRMRYCDRQGKLNLDNKMPPDQGPEGYLPWFSIPERRAASDKILFGHWASLQGQTHQDNVIALDTGCVWGGRLRIMCLESGELHHHDCSC